jgi:hypothetical protein
MWSQENSEYWAPWRPLAWEVTSAPTAATPDDRRIWVFARRVDGHLYHLSYDGSRWTSDWRRIADQSPDTADGPRLVSGPVAIATDRHHIHVFAIAEDNTLRGWHWRNDNRWRMQDYGNGGFTLIGRPAVSTWDSRRIDVVVHTADGPALHRVHDKVGSDADFDEWLTGWEPWKHLDFRATSMADSVAYEPGAVSWAPYALNLITFVQETRRDARITLDFESRYELRRGWRGDQSYGDSIYFTA